jgi:hypothetical protein
LVKKVSVTLSTSFRSIVQARQLPPADRTEIRRLIGYRDSCAPAEVSFPACVLGDSAVARWLRDHRYAVDVRTLPELHSAVSVGIHPVLMTVHADQFDADDIRRISAVGVGRVVLSCREHIASLGAARVGLGGGRALLATDSSLIRRDLAEEIDVAVDDACATMRFPRPAVVISAGAQDIGQRAA